MSRDYIKGMAETIISQTFVTAKVLGIKYWPSDVCQSFLETALNAQRRYQWIPSKPYIKDASQLQIVWVEEKCKDNRILVIVFSFLSFI